MEELEGVPLVGRGFADVMVESTEREMVSNVGSCMFSGCEL